MDETLVTLTELKARCDWDFDDDETRAAPGYLEEASDLVRSYGRNWTATNAPRMAKNIVISAVRRFMRNPEGYVQSRAGDETLAWRDGGEDSASIFLTKGEKKLLRTMAGTGGIHSVTVSAFGPQRPRAAYRDGYIDPALTVPVAGYQGEAAFPYFGKVEEPW